MRTKKLIVEILVGFALLTLINILFFRGDLGFLEIQPHPYWLPILLMVTYYGLKEGLYTAFFYAIAYFVFYYLKNKFAIESFLSFKVMGQPFLFIGVGFLLGQMNQTLRDALEEWKRKYQIAKQDKEILERDLAASHRVISDLESRIITQLTTIANVYEIAKKLESYDVKELYTNALRILVDHVKMEQVSFYRAEHNLLVLEETQFREKRIIDPPAEVNKNQGIYQIAILNKKAISLREAMTEVEFQTLKGSPLICAPLFRKSGTLIGVITADKMDFFDFTPSTIKLFSIVVDWLAAAIDNAHFLHETQSKNIMDELLGIYNYNYFERRIRDEFERSKRFALPLCLMLLRIKKFSEIKRERKLPTLKSLVAIIHNLLRDIDILSLYRFDDTWGIILPIFSLNEAEKLRAILLQKIAEFKFEPYDSPGALALEIALSSFTPKTASHEELISAVESGLPKGAP